MAPRTQSGYTVLTAPGDLIDRRANIDGVTFPGGIRKGSVSTVLLYVAHRWHTEIERLVPGWCWGWVAKQITGGSGWSNHAGGAAIDLNAPRHPQHRYTLSAADIRKAHKIRNDCDGVVRWGGDFTANSIDQMHWEIGPLAAGHAVDALATRIIGGQMPNIPTQLLGVDMAALDGDKKITLTDYRGRFTDGDSPEVTMTVQDFIGNTWEFVKYSAGRLDQLAAEVKALTAVVSKIHSEDAATALTKTVKVKWADSRLRPATDRTDTIVELLRMIGVYASNASGGVDQLARLSNAEPEGRHEKP